MWAEKIVFVNKENYNESLELFKDHQMLHNLITIRSIVLDIPDVYNYNDPELVIEFEKQIDWVRAVGGKTSY
jgi:predicted protein tyrosine phosphatase